MLYQFFIVCGLLNTISRETRRQMYDFRIRYFIYGDDSRLGLTFI